MKMGAEPKKIGILVALLVAAGIVFWMNSSSGAPEVASTPRTAPAPAAAAAIPQPAPPPADGFGKPQARRVASGRASLAETVYKAPGEIDPGKVDPMLRLDLLAKVQAINVEGGARNLFQFSTPPPAPVPVSDGKIPKVDPIHPGAQLPKPAMASVIPHPQPPAGPPPPPPITLKYYGYSTKRSDGEKKAFFLDGEDIIVASEGDIIKKQYKVVRIGVNSVQMEDTTSKTTQTIPLQQDAAPV